MNDTRVKISSILESQLPDFIKAEFPYAEEFLRQYYISNEYSGGPLDLLHNIDKYVSLDAVSNIVESTTLSSDLTISGDIIYVSNTGGFVQRHGLILIDDEIILYEGKESDHFYGCTRGFSGVSSLQSSVPDQLVFSETEASTHTSGAEVKNLSVLFLKEFLTKVKALIAPGFTKREFYEGLNEEIFLSRTKDFYSSKGTETSFKILFGALYGKNVELIRPRDFLIEPSDAEYRITNDLVVEAVSGDPEKLVNATIYQDETSDFLFRASGAVTSVERILRGDREFYVLSLDSDYNRDINLTSGTIAGKFTVHPKTKNTTDVTVGTETLDVDSTVSFPSEGTLRVDLENGTVLYIDYTSKSSTQFYGCTGIDDSFESGYEVKLHAVEDQEIYVYGYGGIERELVKLRVNGVISDLEFPSETPVEMSKEDRIYIKTLGQDLTSAKANNWFFNIPTIYDIESISDPSGSSYIYTVTTKDQHTFYIGNKVTFVASTGDVFTGGVVSEIRNKNTFLVTQGSVIPNKNLVLYVKKDLLKPSVRDSERFSSVLKYTTNVQNVYCSETDKSEIYVTSSSIPTYYGQDLDIDDRSVSFSGTFNGKDLVFTNDHSFYTGDSVIYRPFDDDNSIAPEGIYFVKVISSKSIRLSKSRDNIFNADITGDDSFYVSFTGTINSGYESTIELTSYSFRNLEKQSLESQKLIRRFSAPTFGEADIETKSGQIGMFINGVEILNYKSRNFVYHGPIQSVVPTASGSGYDIINPPSLIISDAIGVGATGHLSIDGSLQRIDIKNPGFDYVEDPVIEITGGGGSGALAIANLIDFDHIVKFNSQSTSSVDLSANTIGFSTYHGFRNGDRVIYNPQQQQIISGLTTNGTYFISFPSGHNGTKIRLHKSIADAAAGINTISLGSYGYGIQELKAATKKKKIGSISISNAGSGYKTRQVDFVSADIDTTANIFNIDSHGYSSGDILIYTTTGTSVGGLTSNQTYYVTKLSDSQFRLSEVGVGVTAKQFYYTSKKYIDITSTGSGTHTFNYEPISLSIKGRIGVSTESGQDFNAILVPIFSGSVNGVFVTNQGSNYGSADIINHNRQPEFNVQSGQNAQISPIISNGQIVQVIIANKGKNYNTNPLLTVQSISGSGALLTPVVENGQIVSVIIVNPGAGYESNDTSITVSTTGIGAKFQALIKSWTINVVQRLIQKQNITDDDGILDTGLNSEYGLQYCHAYLPRSLRRSVLSESVVAGQLTYTPDLTVGTNGYEQNSTFHSPIVGWAYDGNPIYGPYGYSNPSSPSTIKRMESSYSLVPSVVRPSQYPEGFFVEDYSYVASGDLDDHNGRFCVTPEYPNGTYAYFCTVGNLANSGPFKFYRQPQFPYVIGNTYHSEPIEFNYVSISNQDSFDINENRLLRNTTPYHILEENSEYEFIPSLDIIRSAFAKVEYIGSGKIDSVSIIDGGSGYSPNQNLVFDESDSGGSGAAAHIERVYGKDVTQVSTSSTTINNIQFIKAEGRVPYTYVGFSTTIHNLTNLDEVQIDIEGESTTFDSISYNENRLFLSSQSDTTSVSGIVTYLNVVGNLKYPTVRENDIYQFGAEQVKILNVDPFSQRIRVLRNQNGTVGVASLPVGFALTERSRKFGVTFGISTSYSQNLHRQYYFNPIETVGLGTTAGVGINSTLYFSTPGAGITQITIPTRTVYLPGHSLVTGDKVVYSTNGGDGIVVRHDPGITTSILTSGTELYVAKLSKDLIGLSTVRVGLNSVGTYVGTGLTASGLLYFTGIGSDVYHSLFIGYDNSLEGSITKRVVTVSTGQTHGLNVGDKIDLSVVSGVTTNVVIKYNATHNRMITNPIDFVATDVNTVTNEITIPNHGFVTSQKVIHDSLSPSGGLSDDTIYYVIVVTNNKIKLANTIYNSTNNIAVDITSADIGTLSPINPPLTVTSNSVVEFDLSDSSLAYYLGLSQLSAFDFNLYGDNQLRNEFNSTQSTTEFEVEYSGSVGVDINAKCTLTLNSEIPKTIYYSLETIDITDNTLTKIPVEIDTEVAGNNSITVVNSLYNGTYAIKDTPTTTSFDFNIQRSPESNTYTSTSSFIRYTTNATTGIGSIASIRIDSEGKNYKKLPKIDSIESSGIDSNLIVVGNGIGSLRRTSLSNIGYDYLSDLSLRPTTVLPNTLRVNTAYSFTSVGISSAGRNYTLAPNFVVLDTKTGLHLDEVELEYTLGNTKVDIVNNTTRLYGEPQIIPVDNIIGTKIRTISYDALTKDVVVSLASTYSLSSQFPFAVGKRVLIENTSVGITTEDRDGNIITTNTGLGYNSANYNYALFTITAVDPDLGGSDPSITYNLTNYISESETPGFFNPTISYGKVVLEDHFPILNWTLKKGEFSIGESIKASNNVGKVIYWDSKNNILKSTGTRNFEVGETIVSTVSGLESVIQDVRSYDSNFNIDASSTVTKGWNRNTGFLNDSLQRIHDSDYYQYFSYALKSEIELDKWDDAVSNLNHTAGFKKFSDLVVESSLGLNVSSGIDTTQDFGDVSILADLASVVDTNTVYDFDLATETVLNFDGTLKSDQILFNTRIIQDYVEAVGNRVLIIDDISDEFTVAAGIQNYGVADQYSAATTIKKYALWVGDRSQNYGNQRQVQLATILQYNGTGFINQFGKVWSFEDLGDYDFRFVDSQAELLFYPIKSELNDYEMSGLSFSLTDSTTSTNYFGLGCLDIRSTTTTISSGTGAGTTSTVVGIASTYRAAKYHIAISNAANTYHEYTEVSVLHNDTDISVLEYNKLTTSNDPAFSGLGTFTANLSATGLDLWFSPYVTTTEDYDFNVDVVSISATNTGTGATFFPGAAVVSSYTSIASTTADTKIAEYTEVYGGAYFIVAIHDTTNNEHQLSEVLLTTDDTDAQILEFAPMYTNSGLGTISAGITTSTELTFVPAPGINVDVRVMQFSLGAVRSGIPENIINLGSVGSVDFANGTFQGTELARRKDFDLYQDGYPIFEKIVDPSEVISLTNSTLFLPNHFFVSGEEVVYDTGLGGQPIGIATTTITGIGLTDKLPSTFYVIKIDDTIFQVAGSVEDALVNDYLTLTGVGVGTEHVITSTGQNSKCIVTLDNVIQSPIVSTAVTTSLDVGVGVAEEVLTFAGITSFFAGDFVKVNNEIIVIRSVGYLGANNDVLVRRAQLGSAVGSHSVGSVIRKIYGDYNIVGNTINFAETPYGNLQLSGSRSDEQDYFGLDVRSSFSGRVFLRSGIPGGTEEPYSTNIVFDDLSATFNGITSQFSLKSNEIDVTGFSTSNAIVLLNSVFQSPQNIDYKLTEVSGITSITFTGDTNASNYDVNNTSLPRGGSIVSVATSEGFGYQARVSAGATATVSGLGTISSLSIGNTGGGYRGSSEYEILAVVDHPVGVGTTVIYLANTEAVRNKLAYSTTNRISVGTALTNVSIVSVGNTFITVGVGSGPSSAISAGTYAHVELLSPTAGLVNISVAQTDINNREFIGFTTIVAGRISPNYVITNPGSGYTNTNEPVVIIDDPLPYTNIPLEYSSESAVAGIGTETLIEIVVGSGSSVISFEILNAGYAYGNGEILTVPIGGLTGIPTDVTKPFREFQVTIEAIQADDFVGWSIGDLQVLDSIDSLFNNVNVTFPLSFNGERTSIRARTGSNVREDALLLVFLNNVLQVPGEAYEFDGGSTLTFSFPPRFGDRCSIIFYRGTSSIDTVDVEVLDTIKVGDKVTLNDSDILYQEDPRLVTDVVATDAVTTNIYFGAGINPDETYVRPLSWTRQTEDIILDGEEIGKDRELYEANIFPTTVAIKDFTASSTEIFVDNVRTFFDHDREYTAVLEGDQDDIFVHDNKNVVAAAATCTVSVGGSITAVTITNGGVGYSEDVTHTISFGISSGITSTSRATGTVGVTTSGSVTTLSITNAGDGYSVAAIEAISVLSNGTGWTNTGSEYTFSNVRLKNKTGSGTNALVDITIINGDVDRVEITGSGYGYQVNDYLYVDVVNFEGTNVVLSTPLQLLVTSIAAPPVLINEPTVAKELMSVTYEGDFGIISGIGTTSYTGVTTGLVFDFVIPKNSFLRDTYVSGTVGVATTGVSGIQTGYYFMISNSNVGDKVISLESDNTPIGIGTTFLNNIFKAEAVSIAQTHAIGLGLTWVARVTTKVNDYTDFIGLGHSNFFGEYSWGRLYNLQRVGGSAFGAYRGENLITYSEFEQSWTETGTITVSYIQDSPFTQTYGAKIATAAADTGLTIATVSLVSGTNYTYSIYVKPISGSKKIYFGSNTGTTASVSLDFDASIPTITNRSGTTTNETLIPQENGWYRASFTFNAGASAAHNFIVYNTTSDNTFVVWGAQVESGVDLTPYSKVTHTPVYRNTAVTDENTYPVIRRFNNLRYRGYVI
jgi:hypothetical protein